MSDDEGRWRTTPSSIRVRIDLDHLAATSPLTVSEATSRLEAAMRVLYPEAVLEVRTRSGRLSPCHYVDTDARHPYDDDVETEVLRALGDRS